MQKSSSTPSRLTPTEERAIAAIDADGLIRCLEQLISIPSVSGSPDEITAQRWFAERMKEHGLTTDLWEIPLDETRAHADFPGWEIERTSALGLVGTWGNTAEASRGRTLTLNGHIDVVPTGELAQWTTAPFAGQRRGDAVYGRGACDMKGGLVCSLHAIAAVRAAGIRLKGRVLLESVVGEEDGGLGTFATLLRGYRGDAAIIAEPTNLQIIPACAGALTFRMGFKGRSTHASVRLEGVSTIEKFWIVWKALEKLEARRNKPGNPLFMRFPLPYPLCIGTLRAGDWPSSVPDELFAEGRLGVALGESPADARADLERTVAEACASDEWLRDHPVTVAWYGGQFASGQIPIDHPLIRMVRDAHVDLGGAEPEVHGAPYGSDLRLMVGLGEVPTLHYGPGNVKHAHAPDEHVPVSDLLTVTRGLVLSILRFCEHE